MSMIKAFSTLMAVLSLGLLPQTACPCSLCGSLMKKQTLRSEMNQAQVVVVGQLSNPMLNPGTGTGTTQLQIQNVLKNHPALGSKKMLVINTYVPVLDPKKPPTFVVFADLVDGNLNPNRGQAVSPALLTYLDEIGKLGDASPAQRLGFYYQYLDNADPDIATDAFLEFAKTPDKDLADVTPKLNPEKFRKLLLDPKTTPEKIGLFSLALATAKNPKDADLLRGMIDNPTPKTQSGLGGLLCGLIQLEPEAGWKTVHAILGNKKKNFNERYSAYCAVRFYYNWKPKEFQAPIKAALNVMLHSDMADLAIDSLRRWEDWDMTADILNLYGKQAQAPLMQRAIVYYAVCCPLPQAKTFLADLRKTKDGADLVQSIEDEVAREKKVQSSGY